MPTFIEKFNYIKEWVLFHFSPQSKLTKKKKKLFFLKVDPNKRK